MICFELYRRGKKRHFLTKARKRIKATKRFDRMGSPNTSVFLMILKAEVTAIKSKDMTHIMEAYSKVIDVCAMEGLVHLEALSHERLSFELFDLQNYEVQSLFHMKKSIEIYETKWGAMAKSDWLRRMERKRFRNITVEHE
jgi:16S rRNA G966 N2-methylase RsmD